MARLIVYFSPPTHSSPPPNKMSIVFPGGIQLACRRDERFCDYKWVHFLKTRLLFTILQHDDVLEKKGPRGREWRTNEEPYGRQRQSRRPTNKPNGLDPYGLATALSPEWEELEIFFKLCRGERLRVRNILRLLTSLSA